VSVSLGLLSLANAPHAASAAAKHAISSPHQSGCAIRQPACRAARLPRPGLQADYQFYYNTPGYFPGFYPGAGMAREFGPSPGSGFSEGPLGIH
jgi:hypothetical protein